MFCAKVPNLAMIKGGAMARADPVTEERESLYERDFYLWLEQQASRLREGRLDELDLANLLEEIEDMGRSEKRAIEGYLVVVLTHLLKYPFPARPQVEQLARLHRRAPPPAA